jgi:DNA mismatch repair protein MutS
VSCIDLTTGKSKTTEFISKSTDTNYALDELYKTINFYMPKEIILTSNNVIEYEFNYLVNYLEISKACVHNKIGILPQELQKTTYQEQLLRKIFPKHGLLSVFEYLDLERKPIATISYIYMLEFSYKHNENIIKNIPVPEIMFSENNQLLLSYNTCKQLNISDLTSFLCTCQTVIGKRSFKERILTPLTSPTQIEESYDKIQNFGNFYHETTKHLQDIYDLERLYRKLVLNRLHPADFIQIDQTLEAVLALSKIVDFKHISSVQSMIDTYKKTFDMTEIQKYHLDNISGSFFIKGNYPEIDELQSSLVKSKSFFEVLSNNIHLEYCKVDNNERDGYYLYITAKRWNDIKSELKDKKFKIYDYTVNFNNIIAKPISSSSNIVKLTDNNHMKTVNAEIVNILHNLSLKVLDTYQEFVNTLMNTYSSIIPEVIKYIADVDWYTSCAKNVSQYKYTRPVIDNQHNSKSYVNARDLRHPIIERLLTQTDYVPNDISLDTTNIGILLYGINSAGKSSISKAIGLCVIMAQAGMYVPCSSFTYWPYNEIFTRIPSGDDMLKGQSTFVVEVSELRNILKRATEHSLVIGDELASGTESVSALAIVSAGILQLYKRNTSFIFATHLHDLCNISHLKKLDKLAIYHLSVSYDGSKLIYDRKLKAGQGHTLYGLEVCKSLNLGDEFLEIANQVRQEIIDIAPKIHSDKQSRYNAGFYVDICSICSKQAKEVHHIQNQAAADKDGFIGNIHKNKLSNLMAVCEECHDKIHANKINVEGYKQTSDGIELKIIEEKESGKDANLTKQQIIELLANKISQKQICETLNISLYKLRKIIKN